MEVKVRPLKKFVDARGFFSEAIREDWKDFLEGENIVQVNVSMSYPGIIRAWHRHLRGQVDCFLVLRGAMKIVAYDEENDKVYENVSSEENLQVVRVPGIFWHGTQTIGTKPSLLVYFVNRLYDSKNPDEERRPWNDPKIPYDWNKLPHK